MDRRARVQRSVDALERLFSVVVGLAVTIAVQKILFDGNGDLHEFYDPNAKTWPLWNVLVNAAPAMIGFAVSVVPFYHGMNRHLDHIYIESDTDALREGYLVLDFFVFFLESCVLAALASNVNAGTRVFAILPFLLSIDAAWCFVSHGIHYASTNRSVLNWGIINAICAVALFFIYYSSTFPSTEMRAWAMCIVAVARTACDYWFCWYFYFPTEENTK